MSILKDINHKSLSASRTEQGSMGEFHVHANEVISKRINVLQGNEMSDCRNSP